MILAITRDDLQALPVAGLNLDYVDSTFKCCYTIRQTPVGSIYVLFAVEPQAEDNNIVFKVPYASIQLPTILALFGTKTRLMVKEHWDGIGDAIIAQIVEVTKLPIELFEKSNDDKAAYLTIRLGAIMGHILDKYPNSLYQLSALTFRKEAIVLEVTPRK